MWKFFKKTNNSNITSIELERTMKTEFNENTYAQYKCFRTMIGYNDHEAYQKYVQEENEAYEADKEYFLLCEERYNKELSELLNSYKISWTFSEMENHVQVHGLMR